MKLWHILGSITLSMVLAACADRSGPGVSPEAGAPPVSGNAAQASAISQPAVTGTVNIRQRIALPPNAALTVTVSDASLADAPSKVITQRVTRTGGKQAPFTFVLPYNPADIQPHARILLSAAIAIDNRVVMVTENVLPVITNGVNSADLILTPVTSVPLPAQGQTTGAPISAPLTTQPSQPAW
ncbi:MULTISPECIES: YbaY family lipoprotein [unclassified Brenneria]|uniref:YbaY family lipoprotein n=1 Tax=unclassified Brenneria TaxID=2634434 RepID=UPI0029C13E88|nr:MULTISPECIES: YbaY family lipoprotein [unclassified Brenneria]MDX5628108.1 YbaY family lipoprotein [Brenneria sp. L3-3Z]MDX5694872.1 YbaY family lipoprotein [Brenneria sp. L4-2C]MEE3660661.1 YbaY family lipoprotein [Brenneria sp. g21c3]